MKPLPRPFVLFALKLCVVLGALGFGAACGTTAALQTADTWAHRVCSLVNALPEASASTLPPSVNVTVTITPSVAVASVGPAPAPSASGAASAAAVAPGLAIAPHALALPMPLATPSTVPASVSVAPTDGAP
jgi:hypothetical protein